VEKAATSTSDYDGRVASLISNLCRLRGDGTVRTGKSGCILYIPCPNCLHVYGRRELRSKHLAVRIDQALQFLEGETDVRTHATCMKTGKGYSIRDLLSMPPVSSKMNGKVLGLSEVTKSRVTKRILDVDANGNRIPFGPGECVLVNTLPKHSAARFYLETEREFDVDLLARKYRTSFCVKELPPTFKNGVFYSRLAPGWKKTPQGRCVFFCDVDGVQTGWQARLLEFEDPSGNLWYFSPSMRWEKIGHHDGDAMNLEPDFLEAYEKEIWPPPKYMNAPGLIKDSVLFGFDSTKDFLKGIPSQDRFIVLTEGVLDAARFDYYGIPVCGKSITVPQANKLRELSEKCVVAWDNDAAGKSALGSVVKILLDAGFSVGKIHPPTSVKDFGEVSDHRFCVSLAKATAKELF
jgi:hypothetical protein